MDIAYLHLVTNHIPIIGVPFALALLLLGFWRKSDELKAAGLLAFALLGVATLGVYLLGQGGEDFVEDLAGVSHDAIEDHEKMATISLILVGITALVSLFGLIFYKGFRLLKRRASDKLLNGEVAGDAKSYFPAWLILAVLGLALASTAALGYTGKLGGKIRHLEFYGGAANTGETDEGGRNRRGRDRQNFNQTQPNSENQAAEQTTETDAEEETDKEGGGKGRGRNRGGKR